ncbi:MAG: ABC transporter substrate-binding protein [Actinomycetota bacterium]
MTALTLLAGLVAACGGKDPSAAATTVAPTGTTVAGATTVVSSTTAAPVLTNAPTTTVADVKPVSGGSLTVALQGESTGFNPSTDAWADGGHVVAHAIFDPLATFDESGKVVPYLAESITANKDATAWTIKVRSGVKFHDGTPLNAKAVQLNFEANKKSPQFGSQLALLKSMRVVDDTTLELTMTQAWGTFPNILVGAIGYQVGYMVAPAMLASPAGGRKPIGTGPFKFVEWVPDDHLKVARNDTYWQTPAYLDTVTFKPIPDSTARKAAMDAGDVDLYYTGSSKDIREYQALQKDGKFNVVIGSPSEGDMVMLNTKKAPLDDVRVRRALAMSVDIPRLFDYLDATGVKRPTHGPYADDSFWYAKSNYPSYDPAGAKKLIAAYAKEKGKPVVFDFAGGQDPFIVSFQELYQSMWADIGVKANIVSRAQSENITKVVSGDYQVILWGGVGGGDPDKDYLAFHSNTGQNFTGFNTPAMDAALDKGRALSDADQRKAQYTIVQQILGDGVPYIWTGTNQFGVVTKPNVQDVANFKLPDGAAGRAINGPIFFLKDVWLSK